MGINKLEGYLSRSQVREYLEYLLDSGASAVIESPDNVSANDPLNIRIGSSLNSLKEFHVSRHTAHGAHLVQAETILMCGSTKPEIPADALCAGVVYLSKYERDYTGEKDLIGVDRYAGDVGDAIYMDISDWNDLLLGVPTTGVNCRLFVFWKAV